MRPWITAALCCVLLAWTSVATAQQGRMEWVSAPLTPASLRAHIERLASDEFEGRFPGTHGEALTVDYIQRAFARAGLEPGARDARGRPNWTQAVPLAQVSITGDPVLTITGPDGAMPYAYRSQFVAWTKHLEPQVTLENAPLVFVGYGIVNRALGWNDYAGIDMHGKIAVILINDPDFDTGDDRGFGGRAMTYYGRWTYKFEEAARQGASGALLIHQTAPAAYPWEVVVSSRTGPLMDLAPEDRGASRALVEGWITEPVARQLFERAGLDFAQQRVRAQRVDFSPTMLGELTGSITLDTNIREFSSSNVIGLLRGSVTPDEVLIYSAHWDHLGHCPPLNGDDICNGALDNASGVAGLIDLARHFLSLGRPWRSIAFISYTAEEQGLVGSAYYAQHPVFPPNKTVADINMDGLQIAGPARDIILIGGGQSNMDWYLAQAAQRMGRVVTPEPYPERGSRFRSDQFSLAQIGIPGLYTAPGLDLRIGGVERGRQFNEQYVAQRYHRPNDQITSDWNLIGAMQDLQLLYQTGLSIANSDQWPEWAPNSEFRAVREESMRH